MISICIPIYNFKVRDLVHELSIQSRNLIEASEIILIDDGSSAAFKEANESICATHKYIKLEKNIGRAAIRNQFLQYAQFNYLLFLDCDSQIISPDFLSNYLSQLKNVKKYVVCGGRNQQRNRPSRDYLLRWKYGNAKESKTAQQRAKNPNQSFMTNNFLINRELLKEVLFDERLIGYGHEDTFFGFELKKKNIPIYHIHNPVLNGDLEQNKKFLFQSEKAVSNLVYLLKITNYDNELIQEVALLRMYYRLFKLRWLNKNLFILLSPLIKYFLVKGFISILLFDYYKLGLLTLHLEKSKG